MRLVHALMTRRALVSVSDKRGVVELAGVLAELGVEVLSTGGTAAALATAGIAVAQVSAYTGAPEILDGRVKTLHPRIHGGLLGRDTEAHRKEMAAHAIDPIELVVVNLYPFEATIARGEATLEDAIENIDIGGPAMLRSAAKNHASVAALVDPADYARVLQEIEKSGEVSEATRFGLAAKVFAHTAAYDAAIAQWFADARDERFPERLVLPFERAQSLRYGENPGQEAAFYVERRGAGLGALTQRAGKELSFNNLLDLEGALLATDPFGDQPCCAIVKHTTPCGLAVGATARDAFERALACDPVSAFGSVISFTIPVDDAAAEAMSRLFVECIVAPGFTERAVETLGRKKNLRILEGRAPADPRARDLKRVRGGLLVQERQPPAAVDVGWKVVTHRQPTPEELDDLRFAWRAVASVKSNAIVLARAGATIGIGAGQMSRVDASFLAAYKARQAGHATDGAVLGSDAYFPFRDGVDQAAAVGVRAIVQPGSSIRDAEVIEAANEHGMAMVFTGQRLFRH
jgi:phosphoribosylaminoimidazolecarboxamide formyltransferase / IMP cyclohydrolase